MSHAKFITLGADNLVAAISRNDRDCWKYYANVAHQIAQARPSELREFVESYPTKKTAMIEPLMVLAWRIVGNEFKSELAAKASDAIFMHCDIDEWEKAVMGFAPDQIEGS